MRKVSLKQTESCAKHIKVVVFDLGGTLMTYRGLHLNSYGYYKNAFEHVNTSLSLGLSTAQIEAAVKVLKGYNPHINPREIEVPAEKIFSEAIAGWNTDIPLEEIISAFFDSLNLAPYFFPKSIPALEKLRDAGLKIAAFTDVANAMPDSLHKEFVEPLLPYFDFYVSSVSCGYRKPNPKGLCEIAEFFHVSPDEMIMVGDTENDIKAAQNFGCISVLIREYQPKLNSNLAIGQDYTAEDVSQFASVLIHAKKS